MPGCLRKGPRACWGHRPARGAPGPRVGATARATAEGVRAFVPLHARGRAGVENRPAEEAGLTGGGRCLTPPAPRRQPLAASCVGRGPRRAPVTRAVGLSAAGPALGRQGGCASAPPRAGATARATGECRGAAARARHGRRGSLGQCARDEAARRRAEAAPEPRRGCARRSGRRPPHARGCPPPGDARLIGAWPERPPRRGPSLLAAGGPRPRVPPGPRPRAPPGVALARAAGEPCPEPPRGCVWHACRRGAAHARRWGRRLGATR